MLRDDNLSVRFASGSFTHTGFNLSRMQELCLFTDPALNTCVFSVRARRLGYTAVWGLSGVFIDACDTVSEPHYAHRAIMHTWADENLPHVDVLSIHYST